MAAVGTAAAVGAATASRTAPTSRLTLRALIGTKTDPVKFRAAVLITLNVLKLKH
jgi:hypothetical protein